MHEGGELYNFETGGAKFYGSEANKEDQLKTIENGNIEHEIRNTEKNSYETKSLQNGNTKDIENCMVSENVVDVTFSKGSIETCDRIENVDKHTESVDIQTENGVPAETTEMVIETYENRMFDENILKPLESIFLSPM